MTKKLTLLAIMMVAAISAWAGDLTVDNLTVQSEATVNGKLGIYSIAFTNENGLFATGGTITTNDGYCIHTFISSGVFQVIAGGGTGDVLVVGGGGGGGGGRYFSGGGGAGGLIYTSGYSLVPGIYLVTVGTGGGGGVDTNRGGNGGNSAFSNLVAIGGGGGGNWSSGGGINGGSGGGATYDYYIGTGVINQGHNGGAGSPNGPGYGAGGGGGAGAVGGNGTSTTGGNGGIGLEYSISGTSTYYAGGGGGSAYNTGIPGSGGNGGGGAGSTGNATSGIANTGGGGGGAERIGTTGGAGGSGIVIVRYRIYYGSVSIQTISSNGIIQTSASGSNVFMSKVGIGTNTPAEKLHVAGNLRVDGTSIVSAVTLGGVPITNWSSVAAGVLMASNNLADVENAETARSNLGLGSAATYDAAAFITTNGDGSCLTNITAVQVGAVSTNDGALLSANNLADVASAGTARSNLGLGSAATNEASAFLSPTGNGSQLTGITAAQVGALSTNGGVVNGNVNINGSISLDSPSGDIPMGVYTNQ